MAATIGIGEITIRAGAEKIRATWNPAAPGLVPLQQALPAVGRECGLHVGPGDRQIGRHPKQSWCPLGAEIPLRGEEFGESVAARRVLPANLPAGWASGDGTVGEENLAVDPAAGAREKGTPAPGG
ncbi:hypothetical protein [Nocardia nova]|nr:hypothetical protein [Nocardia nova]